MDSIRINVSPSSSLREEPTNTTIHKQKPRGFFVKLARYIDFLLKAIIYITVFALPLVFSPGTFDAISLPKQSFLAIMVLLGLILWLLKMLVSKDFNLHRTPLDIPILIFGAIYLIATLVSVSPATSVLGFYGRLDGSFLSVLYLIILYYLIVNNLNKKKDIIGLVLTLVLSALIAGIYAMLQMFGIYIIPSALTKSKIFNTVGTLNALSVFIMAVIPVTTALALRKNNEARMSFAGTSILLYIILILINAKAAWWGLIAASLVLLLLPATEKQTDKKWLILPALIGLISLAFVFTANFGLNLPKETTLSTKNSIQITTDALKERPVFGSGPETYAYDFSKFRAASMNNDANWSLRYDKGGNDWLTTATTTGIVGVLAYALLIVMAVITGLFNYRKASDEDMKYITLGATASVVAVAIMGIFFFSNFALALVLWVAFALISIARRSKEKSDDDVKDLSLKNASLEVKVFSTVFFILLFVGSFYGIYFASKSYIADANYNKAIAQTNKIETLKDSEKNFEKAIKQNPYREAYRLSLTRVLLFEANQENQKSDKEKDVKKIQDYLSRAIDQGKRAVSQNPQSISNWEGMIIVYRNTALYASGAVDWIEKSYLEALKLEPTNPVLVNGIGQVYLTKNEPAKAEEQFNKALALKKDFADPHFNLALVYKDNKLYDKALNELNIYLVAVPDSQDAKTEIDNIKKLQANQATETSESSSLRGQPPADSTNSQNSLQ